MPPCERRCRARGLGRATPRPATSPSWSPSARAIPSGARSPRRARPASARAASYYDACFVTRMKRDLEEARVVVVNHHLFFADLAVKIAAAGRGFAGAGALPPYDAVDLRRGARARVRSPPTSSACASPGRGSTRCCATPTAPSWRRARRRRCAPRARGRRSPGWCARPRDGFFDQLARLGQGGALGPEGRVTLAPDAW